MFVKQIIPFHILTYLLNCVHYVFNSYVRFLKSEVFIYELGISIVLINYYSI